MTKGGYREGSGRKAFCEDVVPVHWRVSESAKSWIKQKAHEDGVSIGAVLEKLIQHYNETNCFIKIATDVDIAQICAKIENGISGKVFQHTQSDIITQMPHSDAQMEMEKLRLCAQFRRPARINDKVVQIVNYAVGVDSFHGKMNITFDTLPLDHYDEEYVLDIDVNKLR